MVVNNNLTDTLVTTILDDLQTNATYVAVGVGTQDPTASDTSMENETLRKARQEYARDDGAGEITISGFFNSLEANGVTLNRVATFNASSGGDMYNHAEITDVEKDNQKELWIDITFQVEVLG